jgi:hypothetical protein
MIVRKDLMKILLQMMEYLVGVIITDMLILKIETIIMVVVIEMTQTILPESSWIFLNLLGKESADEYLNWAEQCDQIFRVHNFLYQHRVNLASAEFSGYVLTWWNQLQEHQPRLGLRHINTWEEMKRVMKRQFVPSSYQRDLQNRLQLLKQGKKFVDEYFKEMELLLVRTGIREDPESTMARFLGGLNEEISRFVEMFPYRTL